MYVSILRDSAGNKYRLYKFLNQKTFDQALKFRTRSRLTGVEVIKHGEVRASDLNFFAKQAENPEWLSMSIKEGDLFIYTREGKPASEPKHKPIKKDMNSNFKVHGISGKPLVPWSEDEFKQLWDGTSEEVAKKLNRPVSGVRYQRKHYIQKHKGFKVPASAQYNPRTNAKDKKNSRWAEEELAKLWNGTVAQVAKKLKRTEQAVYFQRYQYLQKNPGFVPPKKAKHKTVNKTANRKNLNEEVKPVVVVNQQPTPVKKTENSTTFKMRIAGKDIELPSKPQRVKIGDMEIEF